MRRAPRRVAATLLLLLASRAAAWADEAAPPEFAVHLEAARYAPVETDLYWTGWIGAGAEVLKVGRAAGYFEADVETVLGNTLRPFEATQANYHLEPGARLAVGGGAVEVFFHHVSRHYVDRPKIQAVDWNVLGVRARGRLGRRLRVPGWFMASAGRVIQRSLVGYRWELVGRIEADVLPRPWGAAYLRGGLRAVKAAASEQLPRGSFVDLGAEGGLRWDRGGRRLALYAAWERRNDVFLEEPGRRDRGILGLRIDYATTPAPSWRR